MWTPFMTLTVSLGLCTEHPTLSCVGFACRFISGQLVIPCLYSYDWYISCWPCSAFKQFGFNDCISKNLLWRIVHQVLLYLFSRLKSPTLTQSHALLKMLYLLILKLLQNVFMLLTFLGKSFLVFPKLFLVSIGFDFASRDFQ